MIIQIKAIPNSGKEEIKKINENEYFVYLKKQACDNKANIELIKLLKEYFKKDVRIVKGLKSRRKIVFVKDD
jgi:uncharacterized protein (TIGR00251 family)